MKNSISGVTRFLLLMSLVLLASGCAPIHAGRSVKLTGFLGDYSMLRKEPEKRAALVYVNPRADFGKYDKIMMDPVELHPEAGRRSRAIPEHEVSTLLSTMDGAYRDWLSDDYRFVDAPGPGVMRFRSALTEAKSARVPLDLITSTGSVGLALSAIQSVSIGRGMGIGETSIEFEAVDSQTGERLIAFVDKRVGSKLTTQKFNKWRATRAAFNYWAGQMNDRLAALRNARHMDVSTIAAR